MKCFPVFAYPLGIAEAALNLVDIKKLKSDKIKSTYKVFQEGANTIRDAIKQTYAGNDNSKIMALMLNFCWKCIEFVGVLLGATRALKAHPYQRLLQEALIWFSPRVSTDLAHASCDVFSKNLEITLKQL